MYRIDMNNKKNSFKIIVILWGIAIAAFILLLFSHEVVPIQIEPYSRKELLYKYVHIVFMLYLGYVIVLTAKRNDRQIVLYTIGMDYIVASAVIFLQQAIPFLSIVPMVAIFPMSCGVYGLQRKVFQKKDMMFSTVYLLLNPMVIMVMTVLNGLVLLNLHIMII